MKNLFKIIVIKIINLEARLMLWRYRPKIIAVTGSVGKTTTKEIIFSALDGLVNIRKNKKSLNSEIGVPLTILDFDTGWNSPIIWAKIILKSLLRIIHTKNYPDWLVLEVGVDRPGDMKKTASWLKPDIVVFTAFSEVPVHVEFFDSPEHLMREKSRLMDYTKSDGLLLLNADDKNVLKLKNRSQIKTVTYAKENPEADFQLSNYKILYNENKKPTGITFKINYEGKVFPINLNGVLGEQYGYPALVAIAIADFLDISTIDVVENLSRFTPTSGRMHILEGNNDSVIIDDSYNSSPIAVKKALEVLADIATDNTYKKVAVLGDMLELGKYSVNEHKKIGELIFDLGIDFLVTVGYRAESIAEKAISLGMDKGRVFLFRKSDEAIDLVKKIITENQGAILLIKGSQSTRMEKIVGAIIKDQDKKGELLVRQESEWSKK